MARPVYNPIVAPNWNVSGTLALANNVLNQASQNFSKALKDFQQTDQNNADRILRERMLGLKTEDDFYNALQSGSLLEGIKDRISTVAAQQAFNDRNRLLELDKNRFQYGLDKELADASKFSSALEKAAMTGDVAEYNRIISSPEFNNLSTQTQQKLFTDPIRTQATLSTIANTSRTNQEQELLGWMNERFSSLEGTNSIGSIENSQNNFDTVITEAKQLGVPDHIINSFRSNVPKLTSTGFDPRAGGTNFDRSGTITPESIKSNLENINTVSINNSAPIRIENLVKNTKLKNDKPINDILKNTGFTKKNITSYYESQGKTIPELVASFGKDYELEDSDKRIDFEEKIVYLRDRYKLSPGELGLFLSKYGLGFNDTQAKAFNDFRNNRGLDAMITSIEATNANNQQIDKAYADYTTLAEQVKKLAEIYEQQPTTSNATKYRNALNRLNESKQRLLGQIAVTESFNKTNEKEIEDLKKTANPKKPLSQEEIIRNQQYVDDAFKRVINQGILAY